MPYRTPTRIVFLAAITTVLAGCVSTKVVHTYDPACQIVTRKVELSVEKVQALDACSNQECVAQAMGGAFTLATSAIVSGSVALGGNAAFWLEKSANCKAPAKAEPAAAAAPAQSAASAPR